MDKVIICPECKEPMNEFKDFFACKNFHKVTKDINGCISLKNESAGFIPKEIAGKIPSILTRLNLFSIAETLVPIISDAKYIYFSCPINYDYAKKLSECLPNAEIVVNTKSKKQLKNEKSEGNVHFVFCNESDFVGGLFDVAFISGTDRIPRRIIKKDAVIFRLFIAEDTGREIHYCGFPFLKEKITLFGDFSEKKRFSFSNRIYIKKEEISAFACLFNSLTPVKSDFSEYTEGFVTVHIKISMYDKK